MTTLLGLSLAVASTTAVHLISLAVTETLGAGWPPHLRQVTHIAERVGAGMEDYFELRRQWRGGRLPDVRLALPVVEGQLVVDGRRFHVVGTDWLVGQGAPRDGVFVRNGAVVDHSLGYAVDQRFVLGGEHWTVVAVVDAGVHNGLFLDIGDALALLQRPPDALSYVAVHMADPLASPREWIERLLPGLSAGLPTAAARLAGWELRPVASARPEQQFANAILFNLGALGLLALLVAWFLVHQVCILWLRRQELLMLRLRAIGLSQAELAGGFLLPVAVLGAFAALLGLVGGYGLAALLVRQSVSGLGAPPAVEMSAVVGLKAVVSGVAIALAGGGLAFARRRASWVRPGPLPARRPWPAVVSGGILIGVGVAFDQTGLYGGFVAVLAAGLIAAALAAPALRSLRRWLPTGRAGLLTRLAVREAAWFEADLGAALGALILAVGASVGIGLMVDSFERDFAKMLDQRLAHEQYLELPDGGGVGLAAALRRDHPGSEARAYGSLSGRVQGAAVAIGVAEFSRAETARYGYTRALAEDEAMASESFLMAAGLTVGDRIDGAGRSLRIVHAFPSFGEVTPRLLLNPGAAARFGPLWFDRVGISGVAEAVLEPWLAVRAAGAEVRQRTTMRTLALDIFDRTFAVTRALTLLALVVAVVSLYSALLALRLNQRANAMLLCALGFSAGEQRWLALVRGGVLGGVAVALALPLGLFIGFTLCDVINPRAFGWSIDLAVSPAAWGLPALLGLAGAAMASVLPAPRERR